MFGLHHRPKTEVLCRYFTIVYILALFSGTRVINDGFQHFKNIKMSYSTRLFKARLKMEWSINSLVVSLTKSWPLFNFNPDWDYDYIKAQLCCHPSGFPIIATNAFTRSSANLQNFLSISVSLEWSPIDPNYSTLSCWEGDRIPLRTSFVTHSGEGALRKSPRRLSCGTAASVRLYVCEKAWLTPPRNDPRWFDSNGPKYMINHAANSSRDSFDMAFTSATARLNLIGDEPSPR